MALSEGRKIIAWLCPALSDLNCSQTLAILYQDNNGAREWATGGLATSFSRRKHVNIRYPYILDVISHEQIRIIRTAAENMDADFLAKPLGTTPFAKNVQRAHMLTQ